MIKKYITRHQFKKIDESIITEILDSNDISAELNFSYQDMVDSAEEGYYNNDDCEISFYLSDYNNELLTVIFEVSFSFDESFDPGDYYQPPEYSIHNESLDIYIQDIIMENHDIDIDFKSDEIKKLEIYLEGLLTD
jgi:hypothetical protein|tara:strand:+ start:1186 stop:1593 length:408 start_codon:yes stop_codon:yes gene_type:complete